MKSKKIPHQTKLSAVLHLNAFNLGLTEFDLGFFRRNKAKNACAFVLDCCFVFTHRRIHTYICQITNVRHRDSQGEANKCTVWSLHTILALVHKKGREEEEEKPEPHAELGDFCVHYIHVQFVYYPSTPIGNVCVCIKWFISCCIRFIFTLHFVTCLLVFVSSYLSVLFICP